MSDHTQNPIHDDEPVRTTATRPVTRDSVTHRHDTDRPVADSVEVKNRVQWGPILAGIVTAMATMLLLSVLGLAIGASALEPRDVGEKLGWGALIYGIISALISFFLGGWVASKASAVAGTGSGMLNGFLVGAASIILLLWMAGSGIGNAMGVVTNNLADIAQFAQDAGIIEEDVEETTEDAQDAAEDIEMPDDFENLRDSAWGTLAGLLLPIAASTVGGMAGHNDRRDVIQPGSRETTA